MKRCQHCGFTENAVCTNHHPVEIEDRPRLSPFLVQIQLQERGEVISERRVRLAEVDARRVYDSLWNLLPDQPAPAPAPPRSAFNLAYEVMTVIHNADGRDTINPLIQWLKQNWPTKLD